jgi:SAM-dependent methyltransferase
MKNELENILDKYFNIIVNHNNFNIKNDNINYELEFLYFKNISFNNFTKIIAFLKNDNNNFIINKNLNVSTFHNYNNLKDIRLIIKQSDIPNFYKNELDFLKKNNDPSCFQEKTKIYNDNYNTILNNFKLNLKLEKDVENNTISIYNNFYEIQTFKTYRYKNRISFNYDYFTIDITHVKYIDNNTLKQSKKDDFNFNYELEVEINTKKLINDNIYNLSTKNFNVFMPSYNRFISSLINKLSIINNLLQNNLYDLDNTTEKQIIDDFKDLTKIYKNNIIGPKPISLTFKDLNNLSKQYKITDKADGERFNLYINDKGYIYLLNNNGVLNINRKTDNYKNTIIDGELITSIPTDTLDVFNFTDINDINKINKQKNVKVYSFNAFDIYFYNSTNLLQTNNSIGFNLEYRINRLEEIINDINNNPYNNKKDKITFDIKKYYSFSDYKNIHKTNYNYNLDGLILMPIEPIPINNIDKIWLSNLKWKPKLLNTIDFKIKQITNNIYHLIAYYYCTKLNKKLDIHFQSTQPYIKNIHIINSEQQTLQTINNESITNNKIVECIYDITINKWVFLRIRHDKTFPNSLDVANKTFFNIFNTFEYKDILNIENISKSYNQFIENSYYNENNHKNNYSTFYRKYQNIIKNILINTFIPNINNINILDIGCGRGGDLIKFMRSINKTNNIDLYLGLDINNNNITGQSNARERFINLTSKNNEFKQFNDKFYFITADINKIKQNSIKQLFTDLIITPQEIKNSYTEDFIQDIIINDTIYDKRIIQQNINDNTKFDFINCQFMIHYINDLSLFFKVIADLLSDNGVIVISYIDSNILNTKIEQTTKVNDLINIQNLLKHEQINLNDIYQDDFQTIVKSNDNLSYYVKLGSTNSFIKENIINDQILTNALKDSGLTSINEKAHQTFNEIKNINNTELKNINLKFKQQIQQFSNINTSLVLKKYTSNIPYKNQLEFINHILTL